MEEANMRLATHIGSKSMQATVEGALIRDSIMNGEDRKMEINLEGIWEEWWPWWR
jgi:hypothetical protein